MAKQFSKHKDYCAWQNSSGVFNKNVLDKFSNITSVGVGDHYWRFEST